MTVPTYGPQAAAAVKAVSDALTVFERIAADADLEAAALDATTAERDDLAISLAAAEVEIARLQALLSAPVPAKPRIGSSVKDVKPATLTATAATYGPLGVMRIFRDNTAADPTAAGPNLLPAGAAFVHVSFKSATDAAFVAMLVAARDRKQKGFWTYTHEPEDQIASGALTGAAYRATWLRLMALAATVPGVTLEPMLVLMSWTLNAKSGRRWADYDPDGKVAVGFDCYTVENRDALVAWVKANPTRRWAVPEIGASQATDAERVAHLKAMVPPLLALPNLSHLSYFNAGVGGDYVLDPAKHPLAVAYWRSLAAA